MSNKKNSYSIISAIGLLFILIGYAYMIYKLNDVNEKIMQKQKEFETINRELERTEKILELKKQLITKLDKDIKESQNSALIEQTTSDITTSYYLEKELEISKDDAVIYIQVDTKDIQAKLESIDLINALKSKGFKTFGYDFVNGRADNSIRYFHKEDLETAKSIQEILKNDHNIDLELVYISRYGDKAPKKQLELWIK